MVTPQIIDLWKPPDPAHTETHYQDDPRAGSSELLNPETAPIDGYSHDFTPSAIETAYSALSLIEK